MRIYLILFVFLFSCTEYRNTRAVKRVEGNIDLLDQVFYEGLKLHPCLNDTVMTTSLHTDTLFYYDTIVKNDTIYNRVVQTIHLRDTVLKTVVDNQKIDILTDSINSKKNIIANKDGQIVELRKNIKGLKKDKLLLILGIVSFVIGLVYFKFKK